MAVLYLIIFCVTWLVWIGPERRGEITAGLSQNLTRKMALAGTAIIAILLVAWVLSQPDGKLHVTFFDVGQGDATFIQTPSGRHLRSEIAPNPRPTEKHRLTL